MSDKQEVIHTKIWREVPEEDNPFAARECYCAGYDVFGDLLGKISWIEYIYLMFKLELPKANQKRALEAVCVAIANPGVRDYSVRAAMNGGVAGSTRAASLIAALSAGAGNLSGGREIYAMAQIWKRSGTDFSQWQRLAESPSDGDPDVWIPMERIPGFDPNGVSCSLPIKQTLELLVKLLPDGYLCWLSDNRSNLEAIAGLPLSLSGVIATALVDLGFDEAQAEMLYMMLRLPGAAAHSLEQEQYGWNQYPFFGDVVKPMSDSEYKQLLQEIRDK